MGMITWIKPHRNIKDANALEIIAWIFTVNLPVIAQKPNPSL
jgi:hypothetical protein